MINPKKSGFSLIEVVIGIALTAFIGVSFIQIIHIGIRMWRDGTSELKTEAALHGKIAVIDEKLKLAKQITSVSLLSETQGHIAYIDGTDTSISIFYNSLSNQTLFDSQNAFGEENLMVIHQRGAVITQPEIIVDKVTSFNVVTYAEDKTFYQVASANNLTAPNYAEIKSLKYLIRKREKTKSAVIEQILSLSRASIAFADKAVFGTSEHPFLSTGDTGFEASNLAFELDGSGGDADTVRLTISNKTIKIRNTGLYFESLESAVSASVSGDEILVAAKEGGYTEGIVLKPGVKILGGYNSNTWERDIDANPTIIRTLTGLSPVPGLLAAVVMRNNSVIDGMYVDGQDMTFGIYAQNIIDFRISNCRIYNVDRTIEVRASKGDILGNEVTANVHSLYIFDADTQLNIHRNRLYTTNIIQKENIFMFGSTNVDFRNNLVINGYTGMVLDSCRDISIINNILTQTDNFAIFLDSSISILIQNNAIVKNNVGILLDANTTLLSVNNNFFANNEHGNSLGFNLDLTNPTANISESLYVNLNPFFENIDTYELREGNSLFLIDRGHVNHPDIYIDGKPSKGTVASDIGLYGGPEAGRIGPRSIRIATGNENVSFKESLDLAWPGDSILVLDGIFDITESLTLRPYVKLYGRGIEKTILNNQSNPMLTMKNGSSIDNLTIKAGEQKAIVIDINAEANISGVLIRDASIGIESSSGTANIQFNTFYDNDTHIRLLSGTRSFVNYNVFDIGQLAVSAESGSSATGIGNYFHNIDTIFSGSYLGQNDQVGIPTDPLFWDVSDENFYLIPSASAVNINGSKDAGSVEHYVNEGMLRFPVINSPIQRSYKKVKLSLAPLNNQEARHSELVLGITSEESTVTLSQVLAVTNNESLDFTWDLPPTIISDAVQFKLLFKSYRSFRTPYVDTVTIEW
ncbi:MAG: hypothetical protein ACI9BD_000048 [Candidatus Marinamargulisbacteria bacterium]|jgi:hypothetical protein